MLSKESLIILVRVIRCLWIMHEISVKSSNIVIRKFFLDCVLFRISKDHKVMRNILKPYIWQNLLKVEPLSWINFQNSFDQILGFKTDLIFQIVSALLDQLMKFIHISPFKWYCTIEHCEKDNSTWPYICFLSIITFIQQYFWSNICWCPTLVSKYFFLLHNSRNTKIA